jgi:hypothetical protein
MRLSYSITLISINCLGVLIHLMTSVRKMLTGNKDKLREGGREKNQKEMTPLVPNLNIF